MARHINESVGVSSNYTIKTSNSFVAALRALAKIPFDLIIIGLGSSNTLFGQNLFDQLNHLDIERKVSVIILVGKKARAVAG